MEQMAEKGGEENGTTGSDGVKGIF